jgi:hypothetical protein
MAIADPDGKIIVGKNDCNGGTNHVVREITADQADTLIKEHQRKQMLSGKASVVLHDPPDKI